MGKYREINGDLITLAKEGAFDVITHGCNCQNMQGAGIALQMRNNFNTHTFEMERPRYKADFNKLGNIDYEVVSIESSNKLDPEVGNVFTDNLLRKLTDPLIKDGLIVVNSYTQFQGGKNLNYAALSLCLSKINNTFAGRHIGLPKIGAGIAGGEWSVIRRLIKRKLKDMNVTVVIYDK